MKTMLLMLLISICALAWRSDDIMRAIGVQRPAAVAAPAAPPAPEQKPMTMQEYADLAAKDPQAYQKLMASLQKKQERSEIDKLMNFFAHGKYE